ncbi:MAG: GNAT family N-acetyltransferase, partial [Rhodovarius sp.]|nr:GNAT family N-acetyltransferase [Rhodovarius sp.]
RAGEAYVLEGQGGILALIVLEDQPDALLIDNVAVAPARQGQGLGRWLCAFAEAEATRRGRPRLRLYTHALMTENQELYRRLGFRETRRVRECGFDRIYMEKPLCAPC